MFIWHWILQVTGNMTSGTRWNLAWAGFLSAGVISGSIFTNLYHQMRAHNCHAQGCWRIGTHPYEKDGVVHKLCRHCHPELKGKHHTREEFHAHHLAHQTPVVQSIPQVTTSSPSIITVTNTSPPNGVVGVTRPPAKKAAPRKAPAKKAAARPSPTRKSTK